jgi:methanol metabolism-related c-type cytochrome
MSRVSSALLALAMVSGAALAAGPTPDGSKAARSEDGKYFDANEVPTYNIGADGTVDWFTYSGFRIYHSECHVCHGPDAMGSTYAPPLFESMKTLTYEKYMETVASGKQDLAAGQNKVMPALGTNKNVMCYIDDIYVYLRARADGTLDRGRPAKKEPKNDIVRAANEECLKG